VRLCKTELVKKLKSRTAVTETIVHTNLCNLNRTLCTYNITNSVTETADNIVFLNGDDSACFLCSLNDDISVDRLYCVNVNKTSVDALSLKFLNSL
jgi:hypothetical protein